MHTLQRERWRWRPPTAKAFPNRAKPPLAMAPVDRQRACEKTTASHRYTPHNSDPAPSNTTAMALAMAPVKRNGTSDGAGERPPTAKALPNRAKPPLAMAPVDRQRACEKTTASHRYTPHNSDPAPSNTTAMALAMAPVKRKGPPESRKTAALDGAR